MGDVNPRPIHPHSTYLITRRTSQRQYLLRPCSQVNACIRYCLAIAQQRARVQIHAVVFLSNHYHIVASDPDGRVPEFVEELNKLVARSVNSFRDRRESLWNSDQASYVRLDSEAEVFSKVIYTLANPTAALLVRYGNDWPGVRLFRKGKYRAKKPKFFFRTEENGGALKDVTWLELTPPPIGVAANRCDTIVAQATSAQEKVLRGEAKAAGRSFLGATAVRAQNVYASPRNPAPWRELSPAVSSQDKERRMEMIREIQHFVAEHRSCRKTYLAGDTSVVFPAGTYRFVQQFGAGCAEA